MKLGCHAVLFEERIRTETEVILKGIADTGFSGFEMGARFFGTGEKQYFTALIDKYGLELSGMHVSNPLADWVNKKDECMAKVLAAAEFVKNTANTNVILSGGKLEDGDFKAISRNIEEASARCKDMGVLDGVLGTGGWAVVEYEQGEQDFSRYKKAYDYIKSKM